MKVSDTLSDVRASLKLPIDNADEPRGLLLSPEGDRAWYGRNGAEAFVGRVEGTASVGSREAVITSVAGQGFVTGHHRFVIDERDPLGAGFLLR